jgi:putative restriction endonuclease
MTKAVFISKINSIYDDLPEDRYHFPRQYLNRIEETIGDWIIYYEPRRNGGRMVYYATAQVTDVRQDPAKPDHYYAEMDHYLEFENPVPFKEGEAYYQTSLLKPDGTLNPGRAQNAVQHITEAEYQLILQTGFTHVLAVQNETQQGAQTPAPGLSDNPQELIERPMTQTILNRPFRDQAFAEAVKTAYGKTCAMTGLRIINGGGRAEVQAAHIRPVADQGPDSVRNGVALCGTVHWMFDRGLISLSDDYKILKAKNGIPEAMDRMLSPKGEIMLPGRQDFYPHPHFLEYHREQIFKG